MRRRIRLPPGLHRLAPFPFRGLWYSKGFFHLLYKLVSHFGMVSAIPFGIVQALWGHSPMGLWNSKGAHISLEKRSLSRVFMGNQGKRVFGCESKGKGRAVSRLNHESSA